MAEFYPTVFLEDESDDVTGRLRPYGVMGLGMFHFNPQGSYHDPVTGESYWVDLKPLHTEGEGFTQYPDRKNYSLTQLNIPMGAGIKYFFSENVNISFEIITPAEPHRRGAQLSLYFAERGKEIHQKMTEAGIIVDYREPGVIRVAPAPLYNSFEDVYRFYLILQNFQ